MFDDKKGQDQAVPFQTTAGDKSVASNRFAKIDVLMDICIEIFITGATPWDFISNSYNANLLIYMFCPLFCFF